NTSAATAGRSTGGWKPTVSLVDPGTSHEARVNLPILLGNFAYGPSIANACRHALDRDRHPLLFPGRRAAARAGARRAASRRRELQVASAAHRRTAELLDRTPLRRVRTAVHRAVRHRARAGHVLLRRVGERLRSAALQSTDRRARVDVARHRLRRSHRLT